MIYINNEKKLENIKLTKDNFYIVSDFDQTITRGDSVGSWGIEKDNSEDYLRESYELYYKYRPIEIDNEIDLQEKFRLMKIWYEDSLKLLIKYNVTEEEIENTVKTGKFLIREGAKDFLAKMNKNNIPVLMLSAGIGNVIENILKYNNMYFNNIYMDSNFLIFKDGKAIGIDNAIIHTLNKNSERLLKKFGNVVSKRKYIILFGDVISDINMVNPNSIENTITVGFLDNKIEENLKFYNERFDIVCTDNTSFTEIYNYLRDKHIIELI